MTRSPLPIVASILAFLLTPLTAEAHRVWLLPSSTVLSGQDPWVTVDAAVSNDLFVFEHRPMRLDSLAVLGPKGEPIAVQNQATGQFRSTFDVQLKARGTYKIAIAGSGYSARYKLKGETRRWRGTKAELGAAIPSGAENVTLAKFHNRTEVFVTSGAPTPNALKPTGRGLEMKPITHPNDLFAGEPAVFQFLNDGKPAAGLDVEVVPGGIRYRNQLKAMKMTTDAEGRITVTWTEAGMYWIGASVRDDTRDADGAVSRSRYSVTLEVLPQ
ncbi:MAG: DUF4198 domain-containing protein [Alphaproteobacteria bacterium]|nr:DUF4198 domain-containing protein [Alphaproteobacteria bacterium]